MAEKLKVTIYPKTGEPFVLLVGAAGAVDFNDAYAIYAMTLDEGVVQKAVRVSNACAGHNQTGAQMAVIAERLRRAGATLGKHWGRADDYCGFSIAELEKNILSVLAPDWTEDSSPLATSGDIVARAFTKIADALRLGPP